jgi:hypothetical protein
LENRTAYFLAVLLFCIPDEAIAAIRHETLFCVIVRYDVNDQQWHRAIAVSNPTQITREYKQQDDH